MIEKYFIDIRLIWFLLCKEKTLTTGLACENNQKHRQRSWLQVPVKDVGSFNILLFWRPSCMGWSFFVLRIILYTCKEIIRFSTRCNYHHFKLLQELTFILFDQKLFFANFIFFLSLSFQLIRHRAVLPPLNTAKLSAQRKKLKLQDKYSLKFWSWK